MPSSSSVDVSKVTTASQNNENIKLRSVKEVFLFMHPTVRISRNIRALWFFDRLHKRIKIGLDQYEKSSQIEVVGIVPDDEVDRGDEDEEFVITENTLVTYMSHLYRLHPGFEPFFLCCRVEWVHSTATGYRITATEFGKCDEGFPIPRNPFIAVAGDHVLLQGVILDSDNLEDVLGVVHRKLECFITNLWTFANMQLCNWNADRRRMRYQDDYLTGLFNSETAIVCDSRGYVQPDWALIFMLRMGLIGVQMLPENTQSNIIVITDGVVGMPNAQALTQLLTQLRSFTVSCSFIQLSPPLSDDSVFGNFSSPELLMFLAQATFGTYIYDQKSIVDPEPTQLNTFHRAFLCWSFQRAMASNDFIVELLQAVNTEFVQLSSRDSDRRLYKRLWHETSLENLLYVRLREGYTVAGVKLGRERLVRKSSDGKRYETERKESTYIKVELRLPWKPLVFINYDIKLPWSSQSSSSKRELIEIKVWLEAPFHLLKDFLSTEKFESEQRQNSVDAMKTTMHSIMQADRFLIHIHRFNSDPEYYAIPPEAAEAYGLFYPGPDQSIIPNKEMQMRHPKFVDFWFLVCGMDEGIWQKWVHTHTIRLLLAPEEPLPNNLITGNGQLSVKTSYTKLHDLLRRMTSFTLVQYQAYITFIFGEESKTIPKYFYIVRTSQEGPCVIVKIAFLGGIGAPERKRVEEDLKRQLTIMAINRDLHYTSMNKFPEFRRSFSRTGSNLYSIARKEQLAVTIVTKPLERILIRYRGFPYTYDSIIRLEEETHPAVVRDIVLHNSIAKYLICRRRVWCVPRMFKKPELMPFEAAEYILQAVLQRHMNQGFKIAHCENGVLSLCRQSGRQSIEQFIIFPPSPYMRGYRNNDIPNARKSGYRGQIIEYDHPEYEMFLMTEIWTEPESSCDPEECVIYHLSADIVEKDADLISVLCTFDQLVRACQMHKTACVTFKIKTCNDRTPFEVLNQSVSISHSTFDLCTLLRNSIEKRLMLFPSIGFDDSDPISEKRLNNLVQCLHSEMTSVNDVCLELTEKGGWTDFAEGLEYNFDDTDSLDSKRSRPKTKVGKDYQKIRIYVSRIAPAKLIVSVMLVEVEDILEVTSDQRPAIPVLIYLLDEPVIARRLALTDERPNTRWQVNDFRNQRENVLASLNQQIQDSKSVSEGTIESCWFQPTRAKDDTGMFNAASSFSACCDIIEEKVYSRALVAAVFSSLADGVYVPEDVFYDAMQDRSDHTTLQLAGLSRLQAVVCKHIDHIGENFGFDDDSETEEDKKKCGQSLLNVDYLLQKYNFKPVPQIPTFFYYCPNVDRDRDDAMLNTMVIEAVDSQTDRSSSEHDDFAPCEDEEKNSEEDNSRSEGYEDEESERSDYGSSHDSSFARGTPEDFDEDAESGLRCIESDLPSYCEVCPLFVQFSCTITTLEGSSKNIHINRLPYCIRECFEKCRAKDILGSQITVDMCVFTWTAHLAIRCEYDDPYSYNDYNRMYETTYCYRYEDYSIEKEVENPTSIFDELPERESSIILQLQAGLENMIKSEMLLYLSRLKTENATKANITDIVEFVKGAKSAFLDDFIELNPNCPPFVSILVEEYDCNFVIDWAEGIAMMSTMIDGHVVCANSYHLIALPRRKKECKLYLYCDRVANSSPSYPRITELQYHKFFDNDQQDEWTVDQEKHLEAQDSDECHMFNDFWLVVKAEKRTRKIGVYLCQRHALVNDAAFKEICVIVAGAVRRTNQLVLLERMRRTMIADALLVAPASSESTKDKLDSTSSEDDIEGSPGVPELLSERFTYFENAFFACDIVWHHWFEIHPRLIAPRFNNGIVPNSINAPAAQLALSIGLEQLAIRNRNNLYLLDNEDSVFYLRLHTDTDSFLKTSCSTASKNWVEKNGSSFNNHILLAAYGCNEPKEEITERVREILRKRLDQRVMEEIVFSFAKNSQAHLNIVDVSFIQPPGSEPFNKVYFTIPHLIDDFLGSYAFFLKQLLLTFSITPRIRESSGSSRKSSTTGNSSTFLPYLARTSKADFTRIQDSSAFFLVVKPRASGSGNVGLALIDVSFVKPDGNPKDLPNPPKMSSSVRHIFPATNSKGRTNQANHLSQELTKTRTLTSLSDSKFPGVCSLVQCAIWQVGDVGLEELQEKVRVSVQQALCDVVTEYGLLSLFLCEALPTPFSPGLRSADSQRLSIDSHRHLSGDQTHNSHQPQDFPKRSNSGSASPANPSASNLQRASTATMFPFNGPSLAQKAASVCGEHGTGDDGIVPNGFTKTSVGKLHQKTSYEHPRRRPSGPAPMDCLQTNFVVTMAAWFDHVVKELNKLTTVFKSVRKMDFSLDCDIAASKLVQVIYRELAKVIPLDVLTIYATHEADALKSGRRFQPMSPENIASYEFQDLGRVVNPDNETIDIILVGHERTPYHLRELGSVPAQEPSVRPSHVKIKAEDFQMHMKDINRNIPRKRLLYLVVSGETLTLYMYNYVSKVVEDVQEVVNIAVSWINARSWLLRYIGLQKMGIFHLNSISISKQSSNPFMPLTWMDPRLLIDCDYPKPQHMKLKFPNDFTHIQAQINFRTYRNAEHFFVPKNLDPNSIFYDQTSQMLELRSQLIKSVRNRDYLIEIHHGMLHSGLTKVKEDAFQEFMIRVKDVHFVKTPLLLLKGWRLRIGEIRAAGSRQPAAKLGRKTSVAKSEVSRASARRNNKPKPPRRPSVHCPATVEDEPAIYRIQYMLLRDYINYLRTIGFRVLIVEEEEERRTSCEFIKGELIFHPAVAKTSTIWLFLPLPCGILFCKLFFSKPYFGVHFFTWIRPTEPAPVDEAISLDDSLHNDAEIEELQVQMESYKNYIISKCHVHSFTYDYHLRTISMYLNGNDEYGIFSTGFDAEGFLLDFLKYYKGRPPNARNCLYEDHVKYEQLEVSRCEISDYFLNEKIAIGRKDRWRILRLRARSIPNSDSYMLISQEDEEFLMNPYQLVRVVMLDRSHDHRERSPKNIMLKFYVLLITQESFNPMEDFVIEEMEDPSLGEFKELATFADEEEDEFVMDDELFSSRGDDLMTSSAFERFDPKNPLRRRFCSGDTALMNSRKKKTSMTMMRRRTSTDAQALRMNPGDIMTSSDSDLPNASRRQSKVDFLGADLSPSPSKVSIQRIPPRRHRKSHTRVDRERNSIVVLEQVFYVHYVSPKQHELQGHLEDTVSLCKVALKKWVSDAEWYCRRDKLWTSLFSSVVIPQRSMASSIVLPGRLDFRELTGDPRSSVRQIAQVTNKDMSPNDLENLMNMTTISSLKGEMADLCKLLKNSNSAMVFKYVVEYFGDRCRYFDHVKKCLLIIDPNNVQTVALILRYDPKQEQFELVTMFKDKGLVTDAYADNLKADECRLSHEVSTCLMSFIWVDLLQNPTGSKRGN
ncbi:hypothetical protein L596_002078 [Steinernema carpocapsae]|uniref:Protein SZT2 n=1 Tax=Steinernema carpocapsae TaxID=34508 RepID=A0A4U8UNH9_STECR|nr:hypothetical protein L596_002078 [Steinernema carpocapsae]